MQTLLERAGAASIDAEVRERAGMASNRASRYLILGMPNGRRKLNVMVFPRDVDTFLSFSFEEYVVLGDYVAFVDKTSGRIESQLTGPGVAGRMNIARQLQLLPGVEIISDGDVEIDQDDPDDVANGSRTIGASNWKLAVTRDGVEIEISPSTAEFGAFFGQGTTVKITGSPSTEHDASVEVLERYAQAMLFDLDLVYDVPVQLGKRRRTNRPRRRDRPERQPQFPRNQYAAQALELYQYGRSAAGLPLLEYLAYYQSIEYFFPFFAREETVNSVRSQLLHPGFDAQNDQALNRLINLAAPAARGGMAEKEQLRATIRACITDPDLRAFIESSPEHTNHFCTRNQSQAIRGVGAIQLDHSQTDLRDQVADRIYAIRCRIVHAKQDGGGANEEVLLPSSAEANSLQTDIELVRLLAQRSLVARAARA